MTKAIMIVGVGGQGTLLASRILGNVLIAAGHDVKVSEVHGMSQRGGSVVTYVKFGEKVYSPVVEKGEADLILSFEQLEAARWLPFLKKGGKIITSNQSIAPMPVITGVAAYPDDIINKITASGIDITAVDALSLAKDAGSTKAVNVVLIGLLSKFPQMAEIPREAWLNAIKQCVPAKALDINLKAFANGEKMFA